VARFGIVENSDDPADVGVLVVAVEGAGEPHRVARVVALVELLAAREASRASRNNLTGVLASAFAAWK